MGTPFAGFTSATRYTSVPNPVFGPLLEEIQDLAELKVILRGFWLLHRNRGLPRRVSLEEFLSDQTLLRGLKDHEGGARDAIVHGLALAVERGIFLAHDQEQTSGQGVFYLLNTDSGRRALSQLSSDLTSASGASSGFGLGDALIPAEEPASERPNIFALYEDNVGMISPILAEELKEAEELYPWNWLADAFKIAVTQNRRSWGYIAGILRRWAAEGKGSEGRGSGGPAPRAGKGLEGRENGEPGRHIEKSDRQKFLEDYQRRWSKAPDQPTRN